MKAVQIPDLHLLVKSSWQSSQMVMEAFMRTTLGRKLRVISDPRPPPSQDTPPPSHTPWPLPAPLPAAFASPRPASEAAPCSVSCQVLPCGQPRGAAPHPNRYGGRRTRPHSLFLPLLQRNLGAGVWTALLHPLRLASSSQQWCPPRPRLQVS